MGSRSSKANEKYTYTSLQRICFSVQDKEVGYLGGGPEGIEDLFFRSSPLIELCRCQRARPCDRLRSVNLIKDTIMSKNRRPVVACARSLVSTRELAIQHEIGELGRGLKFCDMLYNVHDTRIPIRCSKKWSLCTIP